MAGYILLGRRGYIYLTDVLYTFGWQATDHLALPEKNAEVAIAISEKDLEESNIEPTDIKYWGVIQEWPTSLGRSLRRGGGHQWVIAKPVRLRVFPWSWVELKVP